MRGHPLSGAPSPSRPPRRRSSRFRTAALVFRREIGAAAPFASGQHLGHPWDASVGVATCEVDVQCRVSCPLGSTNRTCPRPTRSGRTNRCSSSPATAHALCIDNAIARPHDIGHLYRMQESTTTRTHNQRIQRRQWPVSTDRRSALVSEPVELIGSGRGRWSVVEGPAACWLADRPTSSGPRPSWQAAPSPPSQALRLPLRRRRGASRHRCP